MLRNDSPAGLMVNDSSHFDQRNETSVQPRQYNGYSAEQNKIKESTGMWRYLIAVTASFGVFGCISQRVAFTVSLVSMINTSDTSQLNASDECPPPSQYHNSTPSKVGEFPWNGNVESTLVGAMFYGYFVTQLPGGLLAEKFGARLTIGFVSLLSGVLTMLCPMLARWDYNALLVARVFIGLMQGPLFPSYYALCAKWAPVMERTKLLTVSSAGESVGYFATTIASGYLSDSNFLGGWPAPLYLTGGYSCLWFFVWMAIAHNSPAEHHWVSDKERMYIEQSLRDDNMPKYKSPPWRKIFRSPAVLCLTVYFTCFGIGFYLFFSCVPLYMKQVLHYDMSQDGLIMSMPYLAGFFVVLSAGVLVDVIRRKRWLSTTAARKLFTIIGTVCVSACMVGIALVECDHVLVIILLIVGFSLNNVSAAGAVVTVLDFAPLYAGTLMGIVNPFGNVGGFLAPLLQDAITHGQPSKGRWKTVFFMGAGIHTFGLLVFLIFGTSEPQPWAHCYDKKESAENEEGISHEYLGDPAIHTSYENGETSRLLHT